MSNFSKLLKNNKLNYNSNSNSITLTNSYTSSYTTTQLSFSKKKLNNHTLSKYDKSNKISKSSKLNDLTELIINTTKNINDTLFDMNKINKVRNNDPIKIYFTIFKNVSKPETVIRGIILMLTFMVTALMN